MSLLGDLRILYRMTLAPIRGKTHAERLESFYGRQARDYDGFRRRLLKGREEMLTALPLTPGARWIDVGAGTGANLEFVADKIPALGRVQLVDLSGSLLGMARERIAQHGWTNVETVEADATTFQPDGLADVVTFSYALTMIPDWFAAVDAARRMLRPGGVIGVVDFYVARKYPDADRARHSWLTRVFWPTWFAADNVFPSPDHVPYLHRHFQVERFDEHRARLPYLPGSRMPYYIFMGRKPTTTP